jgi:predicted GNAT family acetyltransferase
VTALQTRPRVLVAADLANVRGLVARDRVLNCVLDSRLDDAPQLDPRRLGGELWGLHDPISGQLRAAIFHGGNLIPAGTDLAALETIATALAEGNRTCSSIVGGADAVAAVWPILTRRWGPARAVRRHQPLLVTAVRPGSDADPAVQRVVPAEFGAFLPAAVEMFTEELGVSPVGAGAGYGRRVADLIAAGRAFARFGADGRVEFKAEIGALSATTAQVQGVWVRPELRGHGVGTAGMAAMIRHGLRLAPTVSLYVNDFNSTARRMYTRLGMRQQDTLSTVLF